MTVGGIKRSKVVNGDAEDGSCGAAGASSNASAARSVCGSTQLPSIPAPTAVSELRLVLPSRTSKASVDEGERTARDEKASGVLAKVPTAGEVPDASVTIGGLTGDGPHAWQPRLAGTDRKSVV